jgi:hypothetical protein
MRWRDWITEGYADRAHEVRPDFRSGVPIERLAALEVELGMCLPGPLRDLLRESDGVGEWMSLGDRWSRDRGPIWSCDEIASNNLLVRADPEGRSTPSDDAAGVPLYFADAGADGILFAFFVRPSGPEDAAVYACYPIEGMWRRVSPSLEAHVRGWVV